ncbi:agmatinase [Roseobacter sp.]|uniref:agmatinase n=1 Tax=Roseobacter sp. TaxID=1907202 RepID=UPI00385C63AE
MDQKVLDAQKSGVGFFEPVSGLVSPRYAGAPTFMRLPSVLPGSDRFSEVEIGVAGVPWDGGTTNRPGARHGPRQLRDLSTMIRTTHPVTGINPFEVMRCADIGDSPVNPADVSDAIQRIEEFFRILVAADTMPLTAGGDHLVSLPILRALGAAEPVGLIQFDAHTDLFDSYFDGFQLTHGTPFRRAIEDGVVDPRRMVQIGIRGSMYGDEDVQWGKEQGVRIIRMEEVLDRGIDEVMQEARAIVGQESTYVTFDIDCIDPSFAPGTGTPEIGGFSTREAQKMIRSLVGLNLVGADVVEVSPPFDQSGGTAWVGASLMFELLHVLVQRPKPGARPSGYALEIQAEVKEQETKEKK